MKLREDDVLVMTLGEGIGVVWIIAEVAQEACLFASLLAWV